MRTRTRFRNVGAEKPLTQTTPDHHSDNQNGAGGEPEVELRDAGAVGHPAPTHIPELQVVAAAWPIYDRLMQDEDPAALRRLSSVWAEARGIAERSLRAARGAA